MIGIRSKLLAAGAVALLTVAAAGSANASFSFGSNFKFPSGFDGFALTAHTADFTGGVRLGFLPAVQVDGSVMPNTTLNLDASNEPIMNNPTDGGVFDFLIALLDADGSVMPGDGSVIPGNPLAPNSDGFTRLDTRIGGHAVSLHLFFGGSPITSWSWDTFNPSPSPVGSYASGEIGFASDPFMGFGLEIDGERATFTLDGVPEASTWALMIAGFAGAGAMLRRARRQGLTTAA